MQKKGFGHVYQMDSVPTQDWCLFPETESTTKLGQQSISFLCAPLKCEVNSEESTHRFFLCGKKTSRFIANLFLGCFYERVIGRLHREFCCYYQENNPILSVQGSGMKQGVSRANSTFTRLTCHDRFSNTNGNGNGIQTEEFTTVRFDIDVAVCVNSNLQQR